MMCAEGMMGGGMFLVGLLWFLLIAAGVALVVWAVARSLGLRRGVSDDSNDSALSTLRERFARGEIDEAEYWDRRRALETD